MGRRLRGVLDNQLHEAGVEPVVDEAVVSPAVLHRDGTELQSVPSLVQGSSVGIVPLGYLVIVPQQSKTIVGVGWTLTTIASKTDPFYQVDVRR